MISYGMFMMDINCDGGIIRTGAVTASVVSVTVRLSDKYCKLLAGGRLEAACCFYNIRDRRFTEIKDCVFYVAESYSSELSGCTEYVLETEDDRFFDCMKALQKEYNEYCSLKLTDEIKLMRDFAEVDNRKKQACTLQCDKLLPVELAVSLDSRRYRKEFLEKNWSDFCNMYSLENGMSKAENIITHVYIGNQFCPLQMPDTEEIGKLLERVVTIKATPVLALSTMPENGLYQTEELIKAAGRWAKSHGCKLEIVINDLGEALLINKLGLSNCFTLTAGVLLNKRKKDFRRRDICSAENLSSIDLPEYAAYLKSLGITHMSYETCGYQVKITWPAVMHAPLYQMNTSGYCCLKSLSEHGDRAFQEEAENCPGYCEASNIDMPGAIWRFNSYFAMDDMAGDYVYLNGYIKKGVERIVYRI